ncbi:GNAT family N-acetyltransferase [Dickeya fangzhongdai]|uniref:GNAT family N-acetyltransferase n=1 Tax=Dickeya fangzhongdai TaxID=1778540 RepID=UPI0006769E11|nr:GNAT family N-acetyltransferase [Dickeya fangzhongdai]WES86969.1 GNAT family N-acetyltransferase [Dickeya fangzhongdai]
MSDIIIRRTEARDAAAVASIYEGEHAYSGTLQLPYPSLAVWESRLNHMPENVYSLVAEWEGELVGNLGFEIFSNPRRRHAGTFGMGVKDTHQHRGIGSALLSALTDLTDNWLNIHRIELTVYTDNDAALALYRKFGFVVEGESKDYAFRHGRFTDVFHMARIRPANTTNR